jgi:hypothetical protein
MDREGHDACALSSRLCFEDFAGRSGHGHLRSGERATATARSLVGYFAQRWAIARLGTDGVLALLGVAALTMAVVPGPLLTQGQ